MNPNPNPNPMDPNDRSMGPNNRTSSGQNTTERAPLRSSHVAGQGLDKTCSMASLRSESNIPLTSVPSSVVPSTTEVNNMVPNHPLDAGNVAGTGREMLTVGAHHPLVIQAEGDGANRLPILPVVNTRVTPQGPTLPSNQRPLMALAREAVDNNRNPSKKRKISSSGSTDAIPLPQSKTNEFFLQTNEFDEGIQRLLTERVEQLEKLSISIRKMEFNIKRLTKHVVEETIPQDINLNPKFGNPYPKMAYDYIPFEELKEKEHRMLRDCLLATTKCRLDHSRTIHSQMKKEYEELYLSQSLKDNFDANEFTLVQNAKKFFETARDKKLLELQAEFDEETKKFNAREAKRQKMAEDKKKKDDTNNNNDDDQEMIIIDDVDESPIANQHSESINAGSTTAHAINISDSDTNNLEAIIHNKVESVVQSVIKKELSSFKNEMRLLISQSSQKNSKAPAQPSAQSHPVPEKNGAKKTRSVHSPEAQQQQRKPLTYAEAAKKPMARPREQSNPLGQLLLQVVNSMLRTSPQRKFPPKRDNTQRDSSMKTNRPPWKKEKKPPYKKPDNPSSKHPGKSPAPRNKDAGNKATTQQKATKSNSNTNAPGSEKPKKR